MSENSAVPSRLASYKNVAKNSQVIANFQFRWIFVVAIAHLWLWNWLIALQEMRQRRQEVSIELRKNKKEDQLLKRRNIEVAEPSSPLQEINSQSPGSNVVPMEEIFMNIQSKNPMQQFNAVQAIRKMLSREKNPPIDVVINMNFVPTLIKFLEDFEK